MCVSTVIRAVISVGFFKAFCRNSRANTIDASSISSRVSVVEFTVTKGIVAMVNIKVVHETPEGIAISPRTAVPSHQSCLSSFVNKLWISRGLCNRFFWIGYSIHDFDIIKQGIIIQLNTHCPIFPRANWKCQRIHHIIRLWDIVGMHHHLTSIIVNFNSEIWFIVDRVIFVKQNYPIAGWLNQKYPWAHCEFSGG